MKKNLMNKSMIMGKFKSGKCDESCESADKNSSDLIIGIILFVVAFIIRLPYINMVPRFITDLGEVRLARDIVDGKALPLHNAAHDIGAMHNYILALLCKIFGNYLTTPRLYAMVTSALTVVLIFYLGKQLYDRRVGLVAALLLLTNGMHILVTRIGWANATTPFFFTAAVLCTVLAEKRKEGKMLALAALLWAMTLQTHSSVVIYLAATLLYFIRPSYLKKHEISFKWYVVSFAVFVMAYGNMIYYNIVTKGESIHWITHKRYAVESHPGVAAYFHNLFNMAVELIRTVGSIYSANQIGSYFIVMLFPVSIGLILLGGYYAFKRKRLYLIYLIAASFLIMPWINHRYDFFVYTRYIMPIAICLILLVADALVRICAGVAQKAANAKRVHIVSAVLLGVFIFMQLAVFYDYCGARYDTTFSNKMCFEILSSIGHYAQKKETVVLVSNPLMDDIDPMPNVVALSGLKCTMLPFWENDHGQSINISRWKRIIKLHHDKQVVLVMDQTAYEKLKNIFYMNTLQKISMKNTTTPRNGKYLVIYVMHVRSFKI